MLEYGPLLILGLKLRYIKGQGKFIGGVCGNILLNTALKLGLKQPRPQRAHEYGRLQEYGMPSGHAQLSWYIALYEWDKVPLHVNTVIFTLALLTSTDRYIRNKHTLEQIVAGGALGALLSQIN